MLTTHWWMATFLFLTSAVGLKTFSSVTQSCLTLCYPMDYCQLPEPTQTHVHQVGDVIQPSQPLLSPPSAFNLSQHQGLFQWVSSSHQVAKVLELQLQHQGRPAMFKSSRSCLAASVHCLPHCSSANTRIPSQQLIVFAFLNWVYW